MNFKEKITEIKKISISDFCDINRIETYGNGRYLRLKEHDSCVIDTYNNEFFWNSQGKNGDIINFVQAYYNLDFKAAVEIITGEKIASLNEDTKQINRYSDSKPKETKKSTFKLELDETTDKYNRLYAYLTKTRKISQKTISEFVHKRYISQDTKGNINFKFKDEVGNISYSKKGTTDKKFNYIDIEADIRGFIYKKTEDNLQIKEMLVFESTIDLMSYFDLMQDKIEFENKVLVSMNGLKHNSILKNLQDYPNIVNLNLLVDNDPGGEEFVEIIYSLKESREYVNLNTINISREVPVNNKDWNDLLKEIVNQKEKNEELER